MKNQFIYTLYTLALFFVSLGFASCDNDPDDDELRPLPQARRTVLIYMCAENSLGSSGYHRSDSVEIIEKKISNVDVKTYLLGVKYKNLTNFMASPYFKISNLERYQNLYETGAVSKQVYEAAKTK